ncbi:hypothetical protein MKEN_00677600 [Mycena kentingensis (nom. inval.)]|nr:hypothetical protein MKEN_00677600 [Mycena kentingensis (nom. inval.)]
MTSTSVQRNDADLCELLRALELDKQGSERAGEHALSPGTALDGGDCIMSEAPPPSYQGCAYLQSLQSQIDSFPTTGGAYIESIFTHRQIFFAYPGAHLCCARALSDLACGLQRREWRADRDADMEAVNAFNYEAEFIASVVS